MPNVQVFTAPSPSSASVICWCQVPFAASVHRKFLGPEPPFVVVQALVFAIGAVTRIECPQTILPHGMGDANTCRLRRLQVRDASGITCRLRRLQAWFVGPIRLVRLVRHFAPQASRGKISLQTPVRGNAKTVSIGFCQLTLIASGSPASAQGASEIFFLPVKKKIECTRALRPRVKRYVNQQLPYAQGRVRRSRAETPERKASKKPTETRRASRLKRRRGRFFGNSRLPLNAGRRYLKKTPMRQIFFTDAAKRVRGKAQGRFPAGRAAAAT